MLSAQASLCFTQGNGAEMELLRPGRTRLAFRATLLKRGLYATQRLGVELGALELSLATCAPGAGGPPAAAPPVVALGDVAADGAQ